MVSARRSVVWSVPAELWQHTKPGSGDLTVTLDGCLNDLGLVVILLFDSADGFPDDVERSGTTRTLTIEGQGTQFLFHDLPYGSYAVSVLYDETGDGRMATGVL